MKAEHQAALFVAKFLAATVSIMAIVSAVVTVIGVNWTIVALLGVLLIYMIRFVYQVKLQQIRGE